ncbi:condensation domain-containing protein, partial [Nocardia brasiliensis]|uniref:condensation domain-containing protein n=1 Tax=Nocardia brasiliensis TaxID=37326 RepID=UPI002453BBA2
DEVGRCADVAHQVSHHIAEGLAVCVWARRRGPAGALTGGEPVVLEPVGTSFRRWALRLAAHAPARRVEAGLWREVLATPDPLIGSRGLDRARDTVARSQALTVRLPAEVTAPLLGAVPAAFHGEINDVLLAGLARAVCRWRGDRGPVLLDMEGHGREQFAADLDLSRTVGWFTTVYPVCLDPGDTDAATAVKRVKEQLRAIPDKGLGYGLLRYLDPAGAGELEHPGPQIGFNYLGRFTDTPTPAGDGASVWASLTGIGGGGDENMPLAHVVEVNSVITGNDSGGLELTASWRWAPELITHDRVDALARAWFEELTQIVAAVAQGSGGHTTSDFPLTPIGQTEIDTLDT